MLVPRRIFRVLEVDVDALMKRVLVVWEALEEAQVGGERSRMIGVCILLVGELVLLVL